MRLLTAVIFSIIAYYSLRFLGAESTSAYIASSIPLLLGILDILTGYVYGFVAILFILAATTPLLPHQYGSWINILKKPLTTLNHVVPE